MILFKNPPKYYQPVLDRAPHRKPMVDILHNPLMDTTITVGESSCEEGLQSLY